MSTTEIVTTAAELEPWRSSTTLPTGSAWQKTDDTDRMDEDGFRLRRAWASIAWLADRTSAEMFDGLPASTTDYAKCGPFRVLHNPAELTR